MNDLRVRKSNSIESEIVGLCLKDNIYDFYDVVKDNEYTWYKIREDMWVGDDGTYLEVYYVEENYKEKYDLLLKEYNEVCKFKFKYLVINDGTYKVKLNKNETLIIK